MLKGSDITRNLLERSVIEARYQEIPIFFIFYNHLEDSVKPMRNYSEICFMKLVILIKSKKY